MKLSVVTKEKIRKVWLSNFQRDQTRLKIPSQYFEYYHTKSFTEIDSARSIEPLTFTGCNSKLDIVFLLDSSSSEGPANFKKQVQFVENFVNQFNVGPDAAQFSVVTFSTTVHNEFYLNTHSTVSGVVRGIHKVIYHTGQTYTDKALNHAHRVSFKPQHGGRPDAEKIVIVLTDGISADPTHTRYISYWLMKWIHYNTYRILNYRKWWKEERLLPWSKHIKKFDLNTCKRNLNFTIIYLISNSFCI